MKPNKNKHEGSKDKNEGKILNAGKIFSFKKEEKKKHKRKNRRKIHLVF